MTTLQIKQAAAEIASRIPELAQDPTNNAALIEGILESFNPRLFPACVQPNPITHPAKCPRCGKLVSDLQVCVSDVDSNLNPRITDYCCYQCVFQNPNFPCTCKDLSLDNPPSPH